MRLLILTQYFWPESFGINDLAAQLVERGHDVTVLTGLPNYPSGRFAAGYNWRGPFSGSQFGARIVRVPIVPRGSGSGGRLILSYLSFAVAASVVGLFRCRGPYDAIFVFQPSPVTVGIPARILSWVRGAPVLIWVQDLWPESLAATGAIRSPILLNGVDRLVRWIYRGCAIVFIQSKAFMPHVMLQGVEQQKIVYLPNSAESIYQPTDRGDRWDGPVLPSGFRVMFAGNLGVAQSLETIIEAAHLLIAQEDIHWLIIGDGRQFDTTKSRVQQLGLERKVHLYGRHPVEHMPRWYAQADAMLVSLRADPVLALTIPSKVQSYMASGKPIVAALDGEGARVIEEADAGISVRSGDASALAEAVLKLYRMTETERIELGRNGCRYFEQEYSQGLLLNRLEDSLRSVVRGSES